MKNTFKFLSLLFVSLVPTFCFAGDGMDVVSYLPGLLVLSVAIAAVGGTYAQSRAASVALEGIARNPAAADKLFVPMLLALALMESLVIITFASLFIVK